MKAIRRLVPASLALGAAALLFAGLAFADPPCPSRPGATPAPGAQPAAGAPTAGAPASDAAHGGRIAVAGDGSRFEVVQDMNAGTITVFALPTSGKAPMLSTAPVLVIAGGPEIALVAMPGRNDAWSATNDALKRDVIASHLRLNVNGRDWTALVPSNDVASPAAPTSFVEPSNTAQPAHPRGPHNGKLIAVAGSDVSLEVKRDLDAGSLAVWPIAADGRSVALESPVLVATFSGSDTRRLALDKNADGSFVVTDPSLRMKPLSATLEAKIDGKSFSVPIHAASKGGRAVHGGKILSIGDGAARVEIVRDLGAGALTVYAFDQPGRALTWSGSPRLSINTAAGQKTLNLTTLSGATNAWTVTDPALRDPSIDGTLHVEVGGKMQEATLSSATETVETPDSVVGEKPTMGKPETPMPRSGDQPEPANSDANPAPGSKSPAPGSTDKPEPSSAPSSAPRGASVLVFGSNLARLEAKNDATAGRLTLSPAADTVPATFDDAPVLSIETPSGKKDLPFEKDPNNANGWVVTSSELRTATPRGTIRVKIGGAPYEATLGTAAENASSPKCGGGR